MNSRINANKPIRKFFKQQWALFETKFKQRKTKRKRSQVDGRIEELINHTDSSIRILTDYKKTLRHSVNQELDFVEALSEKICPIIELSESQDIINAMFYDQDDIQSHLDKALAKSKKQFARDSNVFGLIVAKSSMKTVFGSALVNDEVIKDTRKQVFQFHHKKIVRLSATQEQLAIGIKSWLHKIMVEQIRFALKPELATPYGKDNASRLTQLSPTGFLTQLNELLSHPEQLVVAEMKNLQLDKHYALIESSHQETAFNFKLIELTPKIGDVLTVAPIYFNKS